MGRALRVSIIVLAVATLSFVAAAEAFIFGGEERGAIVIVNVAEASGDTAPRYSMLWRRIDEQGRFTEYDNETILEVDTNGRQSITAPDIPGEFLIMDVEPGVYALDSVYGLVRENGVDYFASGVVAGPERPTFEVRDGEAIYLGIWQVALDNGEAVARLWRLEQSDLDAVLADRAARSVRGARLTEVGTRSIPCEPRRINWRSRRQIC